MRQGITQVQEQDRPALSQSSVTVEGKISGPDFVIRADTHDVRPTRMTAEQVERWEAFIRGALYRCTGRTYNAVTSKSRPKNDIEEEQADDVANGMAILVMDVLPRGLSERESKNLLAAIMRRRYVDAVRKATTTEARSGRENTPAMYDDEGLVEQKQYNQVSRFVRLGAPGWRHGGAVRVNHDARLTVDQIVEQLRQLPERTQVVLIRHIQGDTWAKAGASEKITGQHAARLAKDGIRTVVRALGLNGVQDSELVQRALREFSDMTRDEDDVLNRKRGLAPESQEDFTPPKRRAGDFDPDDAEPGETLYESRH